jgi:hypothetical protein
VVGKRFVILDSLWWIIPPFGVIQQVKIFFGIGGCFGLWHPKLLWIFLKISSAIGPSSYQKDNGLGTAPGCQIDNGLKNGDRFPLSGDSKIQ